MAKIIDKVLLYVIITCAGGFYVALYDVVTLLLERVRQHAFKNRKVKIEQSHRRAYGNGIPHYLATGRFCNRGKRDRIELYAISYCALVNAYFLSIVYDCAAIGELACVLVYGCLVQSNQHIYVLVLGVNWLVRHPNV